MEIRWQMETTSLRLFRLLGVGNFVVIIPCLMLGSEVKNQHSLIPFLEMSRSRKQRMYTISSGNPIATTQHFLTRLVVLVESVQSVVPPSGKQLVTMCGSPGGPMTTRTLQLKALQPKRRCEEAPIKGSQNTKPMGVSQIAVPLLTIGFPVEKQPINWIMYRVGPSVPFQELPNGGLGLPLRTAYCLATCA